MIKYTILLFFLLMGCKNSKKASNGETIVFEKFPKEENITLKSLIKYDGGVISRMFLGDSALIIYDWRASNGYFFHKYNLNTLQNIGSYIPHGRGKGQALGSVSAGFDDNFVWMYDISLGKIIFSDIKANTSSKDSLIYKEYPFTQKYYNIQFLDGSKVIANGNYQTLKTIQELHMPSGKILSQYGLIHDAPKNVPIYAWKRANEGLLALKPSKDKAVIAHLLNDEIEIFNLKNHTYKTIRGPQNYPPEFTPFKDNDNQDLIGMNDKSKRAFGGSTATTDKFIYLMYSGNDKYSRYINFGKTLYVYNWDGLPVKRINLDRYIAGFVVSNDDTTLYAYDVAGKVICIAKI